MADEHDSWLKNALGVDIGKAKKALESAGSAAKGAASKTLDAADSAGKAVLKAESAAWDGTKKAYGAVTGAYDKVAPNFDKSNKSLGEGVDWLEEKAKEGNKKAAEKYAKVPVVGKAVKATAAVANAAVDATGGVVKGVGDLTATAGNAIVHPIDAAGSMAKGALDIAEHVPMAPGVNTTVKAAHGLVDLARGKKDGEYGGSLEELGENLAMGTHTDPDDPKKKSNADLDFAAGLGGGTKAWSDKPAEAAARTLVNLAPMFVGDEAAGGKKAPPKGGPAVPEGPNAPRTVAGGTPAPEAPFDPSKPLDIDDIARRNPDLVRQPTNKIPARNDGTVFRNEGVRPKQGPSDLEQVHVKVPDQRGGGAEFSKKNARSKR
jgi:hypothetical protein